MTNAFIAVSCNDLFVCYIPQLLMRKNHVIPHRAPMEGHVWSQAQVIHVNAPLNGLEIIVTLVRTSRLVILKSVLFNIQIIACTLFVAVSSSKVFCCCYVPFVKC